MLIVEKWKGILSEDSSFPFLAVPLLGLYPKNPEIPIQKNLCTPMFIAAQFTIAKCWKQPKCPSANEWIQKLWYIYTVEFYAAERKKELLPFVTAWMDLENIMLSKVSQVVKDKYHINLTYKWNLINKTSKQNITRGIEIKNKLAVTRGKVGGDNGGKRVVKEHV